MYVLPSFCSGVFSLRMTESLVVLDLIDVIFINQRGLWTFQVLFISVSLVKRLLEISAISAQD